MEKFILIQRFRYKIVFNRSNRLNKRGEGLVHIQISCGRKSIFITTHTYVKPNQFKNGVIVNHPLARQLNHTLGKIKIQLEAIELDYINRNIPDFSIGMMKVAIKEHLSPSAKLSDFGEEVVNSSQRKELTKEGYKVLFNNIEKFKKGVLLSDIDYNFIIKYNSWLEKQGIKHNTIVGRLRQLRCIMNEAVNRELICSNPFDKFKIPSMVNKKGFINNEQLENLEKIKLPKNEEHIRDAFLFCTYSGIRYSDLQTLKTEHVKDGWLHKKMIKTGFTIDVPLNKLFEGKAMKLIEKYKKVENIAKILDNNAKVNKILKNIFIKADIPTTYTFHTSRHTFASLLLEQGVQLTTIQKLLGHQKLSTTQIYGEVTKNVIERDLNNIL